MVELDLASKQIIKSSDWAAALLQGSAAAAHHLALVGLQVCGSTWKDKGRKTEMAR
jgi:hypothetical protein